MSISWGRTQRIRFASGGPLSQLQLLPGIPGLFALTWWIIAFDGATGERTLIGQLYRGYSISPAGSIIGLIWAFFDGLIGGAIFAWLYNVIANRSSNK